MIRSRAFTLVEVLIVIGIFLLIGAAVGPSLGKISLSSQLNTEAAQLMQTMRLARERSLAGLGATEHGVCFKRTGQEFRYILYQGSSCNARLEDFDREIILPAALSFSNTWPAGDLHFASDGRPARVGSLRLIHEGNDSRLIRVNALGLVEERSGPEPGGGPILPGGDLF